MATRKGRRYPAPTGQIQGGGHIGGSDLTDEDLAALQYFSNQGQQQAPIDLIMQLLKMQQGEETTAADRAFRERQQLAQEFYQQQGRDIEERRLTADERAAAEAAIARDVTAGTHQIERGEDVAYRTERAKAEDVEKEKARTEAEKRGKRDLFDTLVRQYPEIYKPGTPEFEEELANVDPEYRARVQKTEGIKKGQAVGKFKTGLEAAYKGAEKNPKAIAAYLEGQKDIPGIQEIMRDPSVNWQAMNQGMPASQPGFLGKLFSGGGTPDLAPKVAPTALPPMAFPTGATPLPEPSTRRGYGSVPGGAEGTPPVDVLQNLLAAREEPNKQAYFTPKTTAPQPVVAQPEVTAGPVESPKDFAQRILSTPDYVQGPIPTPQEVESRIQSDPRYQSAEAELLKSAMDWWNRKNEPVEPSFEYLSGGPSAMPPTVQQPGFVDNLLHRINTYDPMAP